MFSGYVSHAPSVAYGRANVLLNGVFLTQLAHTFPDTDASMVWQPFNYRTISRRRTGQGRRPLAPPRRSQG
jgi:hypothetical protein